MQVYDYERQYREAMREAFEEISRYAADTTTDLAPPLARAVVLAIPSVRYGRIVRDEELSKELRLGLVAAHEYGGHHGYSAEMIEDMADFVVGQWFADHDHGCVVCGGQGCEFCPNVRKAG